MASIPCQNCGRCAEVDRERYQDWHADDPQVPYPARSTPGNGGHLSEAEITKYVREIVREAVTGGSAGPSGSTEEEGYEIPVGISVRHLHIRQDDLEALYGPGAKLTKKVDLYEPGEFASEQVVTLVGPKLKTLEGVRILGPTRDFTQVELSRTDAITLGVDLPMRKSGDLESAAPITIVGPEGSLTLERGAIRSNRHIHMGPDDAARFGVEDNDVVRVRVPGEEGVVFENVQVRVKEGWLLTLHMDTDDANASNLFCNMRAYLLPSR